MFIPELKKVKNQCLRDNSVLVFKQKPYKSQEYYSINHFIQRRNLAIKFLDYLDHKIAYKKYAHFKPINKKKNEEIMLKQPICGENSLIFKEISSIFSKEEGLLSIMEFKPVYKNGKEKI